MVEELNRHMSRLPDETYYATHLTYMEMDAVTVPLKSRKDAEKIAADCQGRMCQVEKDRDELVRVEPPQLYNLLDLQQEAARIFGYTAGQTKQLALSLYEKNLLTDPETDSRYLPENMGYTVEKLVRILMEELPFMERYSLKPKVRQLLGDDPMAGNHAILPIPAGRGWKTIELSEQERNLLLLVGGRVLLAAADAHLYENHKSQLTCNYHTFFTNAKRVRQEGHREIEKKMERFFKTDKDIQGEKELEIYLGKVFGPCDTSVAIASSADMAWSQDNL